MAAPLIVRLVMDAAGYLKTVDTAVGANTKLEQSSLGVGEAMQVSATKSVQASLRATESLQAQVAGYRELAASATESAAVRERADLLATRAQNRLNASLGLTSAGFGGASRSAQTAERDLGKTTRGLLAGSGAAAGLGRSLAFASTGFIAIAGGATLIKSSIQAAIALAKTQRQVDAQLKTTGKTWDQYGGQIDTADLKLSHVSGFTNQELLQSFGYLVRVTGNVSEALKLNATAADVARGRNISLSSASIALGKALGGSETALKRLGITIPKTLDRMQALAYVQEKFAGQASAGATVGDRFHASLVNTEEIIGNALLPTFTRLTTEIGDWLSKMNESGRLQRDVNEAVTLGGYAFHALGAVIGTVDKVTGSFANTLKILFQFFLGREILKALIGVDKLAASWLGVADAANTAATAEGRASAAGAAAGVTGIAGAEAGAGGGLIGGLAARRAAQQAVKSEAAVSRIGQYTGTMVPAEEGVAAVGTAAIVSTGKVAALRGALSGLGAFVIAPIGIPIVLNIENQIKGPISRGLDSLFGHGQTSAILRDLIVPHSVKDFLGVNAFNDIFRYHGPPPPPPPYYLTHLSQSGGVPPFLQLPGSLGQAVRGVSGVSPTGPFGGATPIAVYSKYTQTITEQLAVAQAALTKTTKDDVSAAKRIIARIKRRIDQGHLEGASLVQALQDEATQQGVLDSARQQAAQQAARIAAAKEAAASSYTTPIDLQLAEARAQLTKSTADDIQVEKAILAAAKAAVASGKKNKQGQLAALQIELQAQQALQSLQTQNSTTFTQSLKLQLALAKAQALGTDQTPILLKMKAALERALKHAKGNIQKQIDIWNQIAAINQQLGSSVTGLLGGFKQASTRVLTAGLGLTPAQRKALRARLSQVGPGGTVPGSGVGAGGFIIGPDGRPLQAHHHRPPHNGRGSTVDSQTVSPARFNHLIRVLERTANRPLHVTVDLDGKIIADSITRHQQRRKIRNPSQRRGPNAGG